MIQVLSAGTRHTFRACSYVGTFAHCVTLLWYLFSCAILFSLLLALFTTTVPWLTINYAMYILTRSWCYIRNETIPFDRDCVVHHTCVCPRSALQILHKSITHVHQALLDANNSHTQCNPWSLKSKAKVSYLKSSEI